MDKLDAEVAYDYAIAAFSTLISDQARTFGQKAGKFKGVSDNNDGVQWNIAIDKKSGYTQLGVNLEGIKYDDWPIARFIDNELREPTLPLLAKLPDAPIIQVGIYRDAWQATTRPQIKEKVIGHKTTLLSELDNSRWNRLLLEANDCLAPKKNRQGRASQIVTLIEAGQSRMAVSPHLTIFSEVWPEAPSDQLQANGLVKKAMEILLPVYYFVQSATERRPVAPNKKDRSRKPVAPKKNTLLAQTQIKHPASKKTSSLNESKDIRRQNEISPSDVQQDPNNPNKTIPRSWGVWQIDHSKSGRKYRNGNYPVRGKELAKKFDKISLVALFMDKESAKELARYLNANA